MKPYLAIDIETTALQPDKGQILQIAAIYDNGERLDTYNYYIATNKITGELPAITMNSPLLQRMQDKSIDTVPLNYVRAVLREQIERYTLLDSGKLSLAGKNVAGFDLPWLKHFGFDLPVSHRVIDVGSLYFPDFRYVPSLSEINKRLGRKAVSHNALADCFDVVAAIRAKFGFSMPKE